ncbi:Uncharacterized protein APZ42_005749 [Daphnia magna]|uniref:Uncharacterized protein n=1 Tax=Daphnia magna TaxID=35525 RepID=A0A164G9Y5_9CRUS|nr:Uncharacterized protein APZ42_005749 [Daphnia magna]
MANTELRRNQLSHQHYTFAANTRREKRYRFHIMSLPTQAKYPNTKRAFMGQYSAVKNKLFVNRA